MSIYPYVEEIRTRAIDNKKRLDSCAYHEFIEIKKGDSCMQLQVVCKHCGGRLNKDHVVWYQNGFKHGRAKDEKEVEKKT